nr:lasso peptide biosynthesis B2 protein [Hephaestia sp. MAHUQ-44]
MSSILDRDDLPSPPLLATLHAAMRLRRAKAMLRHTSLAQMVRRFRLAKARLATAERSATIDTALRLATAFQAAARLVDALDQCLPLSFALAHRALQHRLPVDMLIGVKLRPFEAHAWVQSEGTVLSDRLDAVQPYTPILAL